MLRIAVNEPGFGVIAPGSSSGSWPAFRPFSGSVRQRRPGNDLAHGRRLGLQDLRFALDLDGFLDPTELQLDVDAADLLRLELNRLGGGGLEAA